MPCIETSTRSRLRAGLVCAAAVWAAGCAWRQPAPPAPPTAPAPAAKPPPPAAAPRTPPAPAPAPAARTPAPQPGSPSHLAAPGAARSWDEFKLQAARRLVAANPSLTYTGAVAEPLLAIPVLEVELNADGSVRRVDVLRHPSQARDTTQLAIDAVHRAAPYGEMARLPRPWKWAEAFLFNDERKFKPRVLDQ